MAKDRLVVEQHKNGYVIGWWLAEEGEMGAILGEDQATLEDVAKAAPEDREAIAANFCAENLWGQSEENPRRIGHFEWYSPSAAQKGLKLLKTHMVSVLSAVPWPAWALTAKAAGWTPPKSWKP